MILLLFWFQDIRLLLLSSPYDDHKRKIKGRFSHTPLWFMNFIHVFITSSLDYCTGVLTGAPRKALDTLQHVQNLATSPAPSHGRTSPPTLIHHHFVSVKSLITFGLLFVTHNAPSGPILESMDLGLFCILNTSLETSGEQSFQGGRPHPMELLTIKDQTSISGGLSA